MKRLKALSENSKAGVTPLYYSISKDTVYSTAGAGRYYITDLIRHNTAEEIERTVKRFLGM